jgi:hypothetical protein
VIGSLFDDVLGTSIGGATITFAYPVNNRNVKDHEGAPEPRTTTTDRTGRFHIEFPSTEWIQGALYACSANVGERIEVFSGYVSLQNELVLRGAIPQVLKGRLTCVPAPDYRDISVLIDTPEGHTLAYSPLDEEGRFEVMVSSLYASRQCDLYFSQKGVSGHFCARTPTSDLLSPNGALIETTPTVLTLTCRQVDGAGLESASVRVGHIDNTTSSRQETYLTDRSGHFSIFVANGENEICVAKEGYSTFLGNLSVFLGVGALNYEVVLQQSDAPRTLRGIVLSPDRTPVTKAFVSCVPVGLSEGVSLAGMSSAITDDAGRFQLSNNFNGNLRIKAFQRRYGFTRAAIPSLDSTPIELVFETTGSIRIDVMFDHDCQEFNSGEPEYYLVDRFLKRSYCGHCRPPITIAEIPGGEYNLYARFPGDAGYLQTSVTVKAGHEERISATVEPAFSFHGSITDTDNNPLIGLRIRVIMRDWPEDVIQAWGTSLTDAEGTFGVFGGRRAAVDLQITDERKVLGIVRAAASRTERFTFSAAR